MEALWIEIVDQIWNNYKNKIQGFMEISPKEPGVHLNPYPQVNIIIENVHKPMMLIIHDGFLRVSHTGEKDGSAHRKELKNQNIKHTGSTFYRWLKRNNYPIGYQVLCWNCQWSKYLHGKCQCPDFSQK